MTLIETFRTHLQSAMHSIGHAMHYAAKGCTIMAERDLELADKSIKAARKMLDNNFRRDMYNEVSHD